MLLTVLALYFFVQAERRMIYENAQFMKKYLLENPQLVKNFIWD